MRNILVVLMFTFIGHAGFTATKTVTVHGMVCSFCSSSLEKKFKKEKAVKEIKVDLDTKEVVVVFKKGKTIEDKRLTKIVTSSGFKVVSIKEDSGGDKKEGRVHGS